MLVFGFQHLSTTKLLLVISFCSVSGQVLVTEDVTKHQYQAEEHTNRTLICSYPAGSKVPPESLQIDIMNVKPHKGLYWYDSRDEAATYIDQFYEGRLQCDPKSFEERQIKCLLTDARLNDTGHYQCSVNADGKIRNTCVDLMVTASRNEAATETPETSEPPSHKRVSVYASFSLFALTVVGLCIVKPKLLFFKESKSKQNTASVGHSSSPRPPVKV